MSRKDKSARLEHVVTISWSQARRIFARNWPFCVLGGVVFSFLTLFVGLSEPKRFRAYSHLKVKIFDVVKSNDANPLKTSDGAGPRDLIDQQVRLANSEAFAQELLRLVSTDPDHEKINLSWGVGDRLRIGLALSKMGIPLNYMKRAAIDGLTPSELVSLTLRITDVKPSYTDNLIVVQADGFDSFTAIKVADLLARAYVKASEVNEAAEMARALASLRSKKEEIRRRMVDAEENLKQFFVENPIFASVESRKSASMEPVRLTGEITQRREALAANRRLLEFYKKRFTSFQASSDATTEVYDKFKQELIELKYRRKKFIFQGYQETHEGIREIDEKIAGVEKVLKGSGDIGDQRMVSVSYESKLSEKIVELQDQIKKQEIDIEGFMTQVEGARKLASRLPELESLYEELSREVRIGRELFEDISRKVEQASVRGVMSAGFLEMLPSSNSASAVRPAPLERRVIFAFLVGVLCTAGGFVFWAVARKRVIDQESVSGMGLRFAGELKPSNADRAKVLTRLGCNYRDEAGGGQQVVLCSTPSGIAGVEQILLLTDYLEKQREKSLLIFLGDTELKSRFVVLSDLGYAQVLCSHSGDQFILHVRDEETIYSVKDCLKILESTYRVRYNMIFLFIQKGMDCLAYPYGQQLADKMLVIAPSGMHSSSEYFRLVEGFKNLEEVYVALTDGPSRFLRHANVIPFPGIRR